MQRVSTGHRPFFLYTTPFFNYKTEHNEMTLLLYIVSYYSQVSRNNLANNISNSSTCTSREQSKIDDH